MGCPDVLAALERRPIDEELGMLAEENCDAAMHVSCASKHMPARSPDRASYTYNIYPRGEGGSETLAYCIFHFIRLDFIVFFT